MRRGLLALALAGLPQAALAEFSVENTSYLCDRGVTVPVVYVTDPGGDAIAVLQVEGRQILLYLEPSASGARYSWPSDGSGYVWWGEGEGATLFWKDGGEGTEYPVLTGCARA